MNGALLKYRPDVLVFDCDPLETDKKPLVETTIISGASLLDERFPQKININFRWQRQKECKLGALITRNHS